MIHDRESYPACAPQEIRANILALEKETEGLLSEIIGRST
jgi:hypothetical protein